MTWQILWDPDNRPDEARAWLRRSDGSVAMVTDDGRILDPEDVDPWSTGGTD